MEFFEVINQRHCIRAFAPKPPEAKKLEQILTSANAAPSAGDLQAYEIYVVRSAQLLAALAPRLRWYSAQTRPAQRHAILPIGYSAETPETTPRRPLETLVHEVTS